MKSAEVYAQLRSELAPWFKAAGFKRAKGLLGWARPHNGAFVVVWCQISQDGWDSYAGSKFVVEFQRSPEPVVGLHADRRRRLVSFLTAEGREEVRAIQNSVIADLRQPPKAHPTLQISEQIADWYLGQFKSIEKPYPECHDVWFRYSSPEHVASWARYLLRNLSMCVAAVESWA